MLTPPRLSLIVPAFDCPALLLRCLQSLQQQSMLDFEVIVVDDGSEPTLYTQLPLALSDSPRLRWLRHAHNQGRAAARNTGWRAARAELLVFLDADMAVAADFVAQHWRFHLQQGPGWLGQGKIIGTSDGQAQPVASLWTDASQAVFATGNVSVPRKAMVVSGGFDEAFTEYGWEDLELGWRLLQHGYRSGRVPATAWHYEPLPQWQPEALARDRARAEAAGRGAALFFTKHPTLAVRWMTQLAWPQAVLDSALLGGRREQFWLVLARYMLKSQPKLGLALYRLVLNHYTVQAARRARL
ncbi:MAG: glycosyltransferase [Candidatus Sericytochromatia bacterium]|nr:glycosyltransferase [Candidatus Sericytochromatia bacterium]